MKPNHKLVLAAEVAIQAYERATNARREDSLMELLTDLMHWADENSLDFMKDLKNAQYNYAAERLK